MLRRLLLIVSIVIGCLSLTNVARAQAVISVAFENSLPRVDAQGNSIQKRAQNLEPEQVSLLDCQADQRIRLAISMANFEPQATVEIWAAPSGTDCKQQNIRTNAQKACWQLSAGLPLQLNNNVDIPVRKIMSGLPPNTALAPVEDESICGRVNLTTVAVQILYFAPGQIATPTASKDLTIKVDTVGPTPPSGLTILPGNQRLTVRWDSISGEGGVTQLTGVRVYCYDLGEFGSTQTTTSPGTTTNTEPVCTEVPVDAGDGGDAGTTLVCDDGGTVTTDGSTVTTGVECSASPFVDSNGEAIVPTAELNNKYLCGEFAGSQGRETAAEKVFVDDAGTKAPLINGHRYAVAVAATDALGNVGPLSSVICEYPEVTTDFWQEYRSKGGDAGGGCATTPSEVPLGSLTACALGLLTFGRILRRNRKKTPR